MAEHEHNHKIIARHHSTDTLTEQKYYAFEYLSNLPMKYSFVCDCGDRVDAPLHEAIENGWAYSDKQAADFVVAQANRQKEERAEHQSNL